MSQARSPSLSNFLQFSLECRKFMFQTTTFMVAEVRGDDPF